MSFWDFRYETSYFYCLKLCSTALNVTSKCHLLNGLKLMKMRIKNKAFFGLICLAARYSDRFTYSIFVPNSDRTVF